MDRFYRQGILSFRCEKFMQFVQLNSNVRIFTVKDLVSFFDEFLRYDKIYNSGVQNGFFFF